MRTLLIASIGNPGSQYAHTLHSAGHTLLNALISHTSSPFPVKSSTHGKGLVSHNADLNTTFWQSPSLMNISGPPLATTCRIFASQNATSNPHLVILHDELELDTGKFTFKVSAGGSARGHNGLKSFLSMPDMKALEFTRVGVGIGPRPQSRAPDVVAKYVLGRMTERQRTLIEGLVGEVWERLKLLKAKD